MNKITRIAIFQGHFWELEKILNSFIEKHRCEVVDIKFNDSFTKACIIYTFSKINEDRNDKEN